MRNTLKDVLDFIKKNTKLEYISGEYKTQQSLLTFKCPCGELFSASYKVIRQGKHSCKDCSWDRIASINRYTIEDVRKWVNTNSNCTLITDTYKNCKSKLLLQCPCGNTFKASFDDLKNKKRSLKKVCPTCQINTLTSDMNKDHNEFVGEVRKLVGEEYEVISEYKSAKKQLLMKHVDCGSIYPVTPDKFLRGTRCPNCFNNNSSKWAYAVDRYLSKNGYNYKREITIDGCSYKRPLKFDFAIYKGEELQLLIEVDGQQHFQPTRFSKDKEKNLEELRTIQLRDSIKNKFCEDNNIPLVRIAYYEIDKIHNKITTMLIPNQAS